MADVLQAPNIPTTISLQLGGPISYLITPVAALVSFLVWGHIFNASIIVIRDAKQMPGKDESFFTRLVSDWYQFIFFPLTLVARWIWFGSANAIGSNAIKQQHCSWYTRLMLGSAYCDLLDRASNRVAAGKNAFAERQLDDKTKITKADIQPWLCESRNPNSKPA